MKKEIKNEEPQSIKNYIISFIFQSICSLALPVGLSFYIAPAKSLEYFQNTIQDKVDAVVSIEYEHIYDFVANVLVEIPPMLQTEIDVFTAIVENVPPFIMSVVENIIYLDLDYRIILVISTIIAAVVYFFPYQQVKEWCINVIWGSICIVSGFLPLDNGMDVLADKEAGLYKMAVMFTAIAVTLAANYLVIKTVWWLIPKTCALVWKAATSKLFAKKSEPLPAKVISELPEKALPVSEEKIFEGFDEETVAASVQQDREREERELKEREDTYMLKEKVASELMQPPTLILTRQG